MRRLPIVIISACLILPTVSAVRAQSSAERLLGLGAAIVVDRIIKNQQEAEAEAEPLPEREVEPEPRTAEDVPQRSEAPRVESAREAAMALQSDLNTLGFNAGPVDGLPGAKTRAAVEAFQVSRGFEPTGRLTPLQRLALDADAKAQASGGVQTPELRRTQIFEAQSYLAALGYDVGRPDGEWGPRSQSALDAFRRDVGLTGIGRPLGQAAGAALYAGVHGVPPSQRPGVLRVANAAIAGGRSTGLAGGGAQETGAPGASRGPSFDCARASTATERAICGSPRLADLDRQLAEAWRGATATTSDRQALLATQRAWLEQRDACVGDAGCLEVSLSDRVFELTGRPAAPTPSSGPSGVAGLAPVVFGENGVEPLAAPTAGGGAGGSPPVGGEAWAHVEAGALLSGPEDLPRRLMLAQIALRPEMLEPDHVVSNLLQMDRSRAEGVSYREFRDEIAAMNPLARQDLLAAYRTELLSEARAMPTLAESGPIPLAVYLDQQSMNRNVAPAYVPGRGMRLRDDALHSAALPRSPGYNHGFSLDLLLPGTDVIPMSREQASAFLDDWNANRAERRRLVQVVWGHVTRLGVDENVAAFAGGAQGFGGSLPVTFEVRRVTLHWLDPALGRERPIVTEATPVLYEWPLGGGADAPEGRADALTLARELGLPIEDGHALSMPSGARPSSSNDRELQAAWRRFADLAWLGRNPDAPREGNGFVMVAASLLSEVQKRQFFGDRRVNAGYPLASLAGERGARFADGLAQNAFPDEFARQDAKAAFFAEYYDGILARRPAAPLPILHKAAVQVGTYDFDAQAFPLEGLENAVLRVAGTLNHQPDPKNRRDEGLHSADRISGLPSALPMPPDQARLLRDALAAARSHGGGHLTLAWWSELDWTEDGEAVEGLLVDQRWAADEGQTPAGRATLKRIALFLDDGLTQPLMEIDPQAVLMDLPEPEVLDEATLSTLARIDAVQPATMRDLMAAVARAMGGGDAVWTALAERTAEVQAANEFDKAAATRSAAQALRARPEGPLWLAGWATLSGYDLASESFAFQEGSGYVRFDVRRDGGEAQVTPVLVGPEVFQRLPVDPKLAQQLVEASGGDRRQVRFVLRAETMNAVDPAADDPRRAGRSYELRLRPVEVMFYTVDEMTRSPKDVLAALDYREANRSSDERLSREFAARDFAGLAEIRPKIDVHVLDLIALGAGGPLPRGDGLAAAMLSAAAHESGPDALPGPRFFGGAASPPQGPEAELLAPAFHSYLRAKAQALGRRFVLRAGPPGNRECSAAMRYEQPVAGSDASVFRAVASAYDDSLDIRRRLREATGPFALERQAAWLRGRPSTRYGGACDNWYAFLVLDDAVHGGPAASERAVEIAFTLTGAELHEGAGVLRDIIVRGTVDETRVVAADGSLGAPLAPVAPELEARPSQVAARRDPAAQAPSVPQLPPAAQPAAAPDAALTLDGAAPRPRRTQGDAAAWPEGLEVSLEMSDRDVLGLRIGQSMADAESVILERGGVLGSFETQADAATDAVEPAVLAYRRVYVLRDGTESITLASYAPDGPVLTIMRRMVLPQGSLPFDRIEAGLNGKYGDPTGDGEVLGMDGMKIWIDGGLDQERAICGALIAGHRSPRDFVRREGVGDTTWRPAPGAQPAAERGLPDLPAEMLRHMSACGEVLVYAEEPAATWGKSGFGLVLVDFDALGAASEAMSRSGTATDLEIDF